MKNIGYMPIAASGTQASMSVPSGKKLKILSMVGTWGAGVKGDVLQAAAFLTGSVAEIVWNTGSHPIGGSANGNWCAAVGLSGNAPLLNDETLATGVMNYAAFQLSCWALPEMQLVGNITVNVGTSLGTNMVIQKITYELDDAP
jgi:hypothetical protein